MGGLWVAPVGHKPNFVPFEHPYQASADSKWTMINPGKWSDIQVSGTELQAAIQPGSDWWSTVALESADDGTAYVQEVKSDQNFRACVRLSGQFKEQFDQAALFLHVEGGDGVRWVKGGVENENGANTLGTVVKLQYADWAYANVDMNPDDEAIVEFVRIKADLQIRMHRGESLPAPNKTAYTRIVNGFFYDSVKKENYAKRVRIGIAACQPAKDKPQFTARWNEFILDLDVDLDSE